MELFNVGGATWSDLVGWAVVCSPGYAVLVADVFFGVKL
jgi:hypothetical protein